MTMKVEIVGLNSKSQKFLKENCQTDLLEIFINKKLVSSEILLHSVPGVFSYSSEFLVEEKVVFPGYLLKSGELVYEKVVDEALDNHNILKVHTSLVHIGNENKVLNYE